MLWNELLIAVAGGAFGAIATIISIIVKQSRARKEDWWKRFEWASGAFTSSDENLRATAREVLEELAEDSTAADSDRKMARALLTNRVKIYVAGSPTREVQTKV